MVPWSSSTFSSNLTFGPNLRTSAAWMPSRSSSRRSERSSCLAVVSSRNAANISVEPAIVLLQGIGAPLLSHGGPVHQQRRFTDRVEGDSHLGALLRPERDVGVVGTATISTTRRPPRPAPAPAPGGRRTGASAPASAAVARGPARTPRGRSAVPTIALDSRNRSRDRLIPAQSSAVTPWPGRLSGRSTRTCRMGRCNVPVRLQIDQLESETVEMGANREEQRINRHRKLKKNVGELPHIGQLARTGAPGTARGYYS